MHPADHEILNNNQGSQLENHSPRLAIFLLSHTCSGISLLPQSFCRLSPQPQRRFHCAMRAPVPAPKLRGATRREKGTL